MEVNGGFSSKPCLITKGYGFLKPEWVICQSRMGFHASLKPGGFTFQCAQRASQKPRIDLDVQPVLTLIMIHK